MPRPMYFHRPAIWKGFTVCEALFLCYLARTTTAAPIDLSPKLACIRAEWVNVIEFFIVNYFAHAATVPAWPGAKFRNNFEWIIVTVMFPFSGLANSLSLMAHFSFHCGRFLSGSDVQKAIGAKAFVVAIPENLRFAPVVSFFLLTLML